MPLTALSCWMVLVVTLLCSSSGDAGLLEMAELMAHPEHYDRKEVVVMGAVKQVQAVTDSKGQPAFKFFLEDGVGTLKVTSRTEVQDGDHIIVEGTFTRRRQAGRVAVYNEVNATSVRPLSQFNPDLVG
jgi:hypothetical protein